ncbi:MAG: hypothetical protein WKF57_18815 [Nakamurella sp.]
MTTPGFLGGTTERMRALSTQLTGGADQITAVKVRATKAVHALEWLGSDQASFLQAWLSTYGPMIENLSAALTTAAQSVKSQADAQDAVSSAGGGIAGVAAGAAVGAAAAGGAATGGATGQLGDLSAQHESGGSSQTISTGKGDPVGGISYGKYQIATGTGTAKEFVTWLGKHDSPYAAQLEGMTPGGKDFATAWKGIATSDPDGFAKAQFDFIKQTHFDPAMKETYARVPGLSLDGRSPVLAETLFSTTVQHRMNTDVIVSRALAGKDVASMTDAQIITAVYDERGRGDGSVYFRSSPASTQHTIAERFEREKAQALRMLQGR